MKSGYKKVKWLFGKEIEIPQDWEIKKLSEITINESSKNGIKTSDYLEKGKYPIIDQGKSRIGGYVNNSFLLYKGDLPVIIFGDHTLIVKFIDFPFACGADGTKIIQANAEKCIPKFLYYTIKDKNLLSEGYKRHFSKLKEQTFEIPKDKREQQKIASILCNVDALIESTENIIENTEKLKKGLMQNLLTRGIGHDKFKKVKWYFGKDIKIPEKWEIKSIEDLNIKSTSGGTPSRDNSEYYEGSNIWIKSGELEDNYLNDSEEKITLAAINDSSAKKFPKNTLLIAMYGATIGKTAILSKEGTTNQAICAILPNHSFDEYFLQQFFINNKQILVSFGMGAGQPNISQNIIRKFLIILPLISEQQKIASILSGVDAYIQKNQEYKKKLELLKKGLMQKLLTGKIRVKV